MVLLIQTCCISIQFMHLSERWSLVLDLRFQDLHWMKGQESDGIVSFSKEHYWKIDLVVDNLDEASLAKSHGITIVCEEINLFNGALYCPHCEMNYNRPVLCVKMCYKGSRQIKRIIPIQFIVYTHGLCLIDCSFNACYWLWKKELNSSMTRPEHDLGFNANGPSDLYWYHGKNQSRYGGGLVFRRSIS